jgi:hypothetical protein
MKMKVFCLLLPILLTAKISSSQDSVQVVFKKLKIILPNEHELFQLNPEDSSCFATIIKINTGKYFYIKQQITDTLTIESGQLGLYEISNKLPITRRNLDAGG